ncbi:metallophosphoesterase [Geminocystis sp. NIES-3709]|uniref:metallophosphoesterase family protein n=1 Tax=Geminocystis sp. NIES-3709 TaxID=1617448 RepID=UPI0005FC80C0|nr:metallophosphoesterase family protein [Geminocystis sp. NIES-3709]BAQ65661.1 serine/threonine protein phosphatase [Geminocystis sp. NIES-3709]
MIAILSDIHGNLPALEAVLKDAIAQGCNRFVSLGDVVGYYAQPGECIDLLRQYNTINIMGNHDSYLVFDTNCERSKLVASIIDYHKKIISKKQLDWLKRSLISYQENTYLFIHGGPKNYQDQYLYSISRETIPIDVDYLFSGHTHVQTLVKFGQKIYCNPGSIGQPRDGDYRAGYATLDGSDIYLHRVAYDIDKTAIAMKKAGFDEFCYENLYNGSQIGGRIDKVEIISKGENKDESNY